MRKLCTRRRSVKLREKAPESVVKRTVPTRDGVCPAREDSDRRGQTLDFTRKSTRARQGGEVKKGDFLRPNAVKS